MDFCIAIIDDDALFAKELESKIISWANTSDHNASVSYYSEPLLFLDKFNENNNFDALFLDVSMPIMNGINLAKKVRLTDRDIPIVFISDYPQFSINGYEVNATRFLVKHSDCFESKLNECLMHIESILELLDGIVYSISTAKLKTLVPFNDILYFEAMNHVVEIHTLHGALQERRLFSTLIRELPMRFVMCSRSYIVNLQHVAFVHTKSVELINGAHLPLSRTCRSEVVNSYLAIH